MCCPHRPALSPRRPSPRRQRRPPSPAPRAAAVGGGATSAPRASRRLRVPPPARVPPSRRRVPTALTPRATRRLGVPPHRSGTPHRQPRPASARSPAAYRYRVQKLSPQRSHPSDSFCTRYSDRSRRPRAALASRHPAPQPRPGGRAGSRRPRAPRPRAPASPRPRAAPRFRRPRVPAVPAGPASPSCAVLPGGTRRELRRSAPAAGRRPRVGARCTSGAFGLCLAGPRRPTIREYALG